MNKPVEDFMEPTAKGAVKFSGVDGALPLSVVLPVYQEQDQIHTAIVNLIDVLNETGMRYEIIAVNDGSGDGTLEQLMNLEEQFPNSLRVISHPYNKGNGAAVKTGIRAARGEIIACMDADGQHDPADLGQMLPYMSEYDLVVGARTEDYGGKWYRNVANRLYNSLASWLTDFRIEDLTSGFRLFRGSVVKKYVQLFPARFSYPTTSTLIFLKGGYSLKYVPIHARKRQGGTSKIRIMNDGWKFIVIIFKIIVLFEPLRLFLPMAMFSFLLAALSTLYTWWSIGSLHIPNSSVIFFVLGVVVLLLGLISEQITALQVSLRDDD